MSQYLTIANDFSDETVIKKSRFITSLKRVQNEDQAMDFINEIKKTHVKANHSCYAFMIGQRDQIQRASDDGEPSGTAGVPILEVIKKNDLHDVCIVVTRYFGGIKLGAGGLIRAYAGSAAGGIEKIGIVQRLLTKEIILTIEYHQLDKLNYWLTQNNFLNPKIEYSDVVKLTMPVKLEYIDTFQKKITELLNGNLTIDYGNEGFSEIPYIK